MMESSGVFYWGRRVACKNPRGREPCEAMTTFSNFLLSDVGVTRTYLEPTEKPTAAWDWDTGMCCHMLSASFRVATIWSCETEFAPDAKCPWFIVLPPLAKMWIVCPSFLAKKQGEMFSYVSKPIFFQHHFPATRNGAPQNSSKIARPFSSLLHRTGRISFYFPHRLGGFVFQTSLQPLRQSEQQGFCWKKVKEQFQDSVGSWYLNYGFWNCITFH